MNRTVKDLSSNRIHNRRVYKPIRGSATQSYASSEISNLMIGQGKKSMTLGRIDSVETLNQNKIMPMIGDEHIWLGSANGAAAGNSDQAIASPGDPAVSTLANPNLEADLGWSEVGTPVTSAWGATVGDGSGGIYFVSDSATDEGVASDAFSVGSGVRYYVEVKFKCAAAMDPLTIKVIKGTGSGTDYSQEAHCTADDEWYMHRFYYDATANGVSAQIQVIASNTATGYAVSVDSWNVWSFSRDTTFPVSHDAGWGTGTSGPGIGAYVAIARSTSTKPWEIDFDSLELWEDLLIGQVTDWNETPNPDELEVEIGRLPPIGDFWDDMSYLPKTTIAPSALSTGEMWHFFDLAWWTVKGGVLAFAAHGDLVNVTAHQYEDVPGGINYTLDAAVGDWYDDHAVSDPRSNLHNISLNPGTRLEGQFKNVRLSFSDNTSGSGGVEIIPAPEPE